MERRQFDDLSRAFAAGATRRGALKALAGGAAAGAAALLGARPHPAAAAKPADKPGGGKPKGGKPACCPASHPVLCGFPGACTDTQNDPANCGGCAAADPRHVCAAHQTCAAGVCQGEAPDPTPTCTDGVQNGNETGVDCGGPDCPACPAGGACRADADCENATCCGGACTVLGGVCTTGLPGICATGTLQCGGQGVVCVSGERPRTETCNGLDDDCDGLVDEGAICPTLPNAAGVCQQGACAYSCVAGFDNCDGDWTNGCEVNTAADPLHCGGCGLACPTDPNGAATCAAGRCVLTCSAGFALVDRRCVRVALARIAVEPPTIPVGGDSTGIVFLTAPTPIDLAVRLTTSRADVAAVPPLAIVPVGQMSAPFPVQGIAPSDGPVTLTASLDASQATTTFTVVPPA